MCLIATFCVQERHELLHRDRDFDAFDKAPGCASFTPENPADQKISPYCPLA
jgi:hypothetical protein